MKLNLNLLILLLLELSNLSSALISSSMAPLCNEHDQIALLHFKHSFSPDQTNCPNPNPRLLSWVVHNVTNNTAGGCCSWEGVTCEVNSGRVTGLDLSYDCLHGSIDSTNPIFRMSQLQQLNLAGNDFNRSQIPSAFGKLSMLNSLNLSQASFSGSIPQEILELSSLTSLDLSGNPSLHLPNHGLASIAHNMEDLTELSLSQVDISSDVPPTFANLTSLRMLQLQNCNLQDHFPDEIFLLPKLESLNLINNSYLYGQLPEFPIGRSSLRSLQLSYSSFQGSIPYSIGNLVNMTKLYLDYNLFSGSIPSSLAKLEQIEELVLSYNDLSGPIPSWVGNLTRLVTLSLGYNLLEGLIPSTIFSLKNLEALYLESNILNGTIDISMFHEQKNINKLGLANNYLTVVVSKFPNFSLPNLEFLDLGYCNLGELPLFLKKQDRLKALSLVGNKISGEIPGWFLNVSTETLVLLEISHNLLTGFQQPCVVLPWSKLEYLDLGTNHISGPLPLLPPSISLYILSNNSLAGELSPSICKANNTLLVLDLSNNKFSGAIPDCFFNMGSSIQILKLAGNNFEGKIPQIETDECGLRCINLSQNRLKGELPRSLAKCRDLQILQVGNNQITDTFPSWLGTLPNLQVLMLNTNRFYGPMGSPSSVTDFHELRIIDLSSNALTGVLPSEYFPLWKAMMITSEKQLTFLQVSVDLGLEFSGQELTYLYTMSAELMNKGMNRKYTQLSNNMVFLILSGNKFSGEIPESIGDLVGLNGLNLSNNNLAGSIPPALGELKQLESLDLSLNMLSGEIPQQLNQLTFLGYLNVSYNNLSGKIPEGGQLSTFGNSSFAGNPGLYGLPLSNRRGGANEPSATDEDQEPGSSDHTKLILGFEGFVKTCHKLRYRKH